MPISEATATQPLASSRVTYGYFRKFAWASAVLEVAVILLGQGGWPYPHPERDRGVLDCDIVTWEDLWTGEAGRCSFHDSPALCLADQTLRSKLAYAHTRTE